MWNESDSLDFGALIAVIIVTLCFLGAKNRILFLKKKKNQ